MPIHILPSYLSSQISSGEIIERPASVVKEIMENSIDAGSKNINIEIEKSGFQSIILKDDGCGIHKKELFLAVARHATSKINSLSDLNKISTFGFRGEALASIRAVSRLTLISCHKSNEIAWKIYSEGFVDNKYIILQPIAHPRGTTIIVENLFYNMPVRLKFIQNKKSEFLKIYEVFKKIALSHFYINFSLKHNNKLIVQCKSIKNKNEKSSRLKDILNKINIKTMIEIKFKTDDFLLFGWISNPQLVPLVDNIKYFYVNNRYIHNNLIFNSIRSAYYKISKDKKISFILYLTISPNKININIHPTKNEIQFHDSKQIYAFIYEAIFFNLKRFKNSFLLNDCLLYEDNFNFHEKNQWNYYKLIRFMSSYFSKKNFFTKTQQIQKKKTNFFNPISI